MGRSEEAGQVLAAKSEVIFPHLDERGAAGVQDVADT
jgi:hypothetical protein